MIGASVKHKKLLECIYIEAATLFIAPDTLANMCPGLKSFVEDTLIMVKLLCVPRIEGRTGEARYDSWLNRWGQADISLADASQLRIFWAH